MGSSQCNKVIKPLINVSVSAEWCASIYRSVVAAFNPGGTTWLTRNNVESVILLHLRPTKPFIFSGSINYYLLGTRVAIEKRELYQLYSCRLQVIKL